MSAAVAPALAKTVSSRINEELQAIGISEVIVVLRQSAAESTALSAAVASMPVELEKCFTESELSHSAALAGVHSGTTAVRTRRSSRKQEELAPPKPYQHFPNLGVVLGTIDENGLSRLVADQRVSAVVSSLQFSLVRPVHKAVASPGKITWGLKALGVPELWNKHKLSGKEVRIGHLDTGVDGKHPSLKDAVAAFAQFDYFGRRIVPDPKPWDSDDHGTHTAATIAGRPVSSGRRIGVAPKASLVSGMVIEGGKVTARVLAGLNWCLDQQVRAINMSLGFRGYWTDFETIVNIVRSRNILPIFAVGNEGPGTSRSPGNYGEALSVGAVDQETKIADFSSSQKFPRPEDAIVPDIVAPGVDVVSAKPGRGYQEMSGTSMATPHIAGLAALLFEAVPTATARQVETAIFNSCQRPPGLKLERANRGIPNGPRALEILRKLV
jgi:subtilisin family serine protease